MTQENRRNRRKSVLSLSHLNQHRTNMPRPFTLGLTLLATTLACAQSATPVPKLNPTQLIGTYYVIARLPIKRQKACVGNELVLYALGDKPRSIQIVTTCQKKQDNSDGWNFAGKVSKSGNGEIKLGWIWPFTTKYWIIGLAPDATWAIAGTPNHKHLWLLSGTPALPAATLAQLKASATAQGYNTAKLITIPQHPQLAASVATPAGAP
jgi:apolipoprotein D and lipocalin family protein